MKRVIAVENNLSPVQDFLSARGCEVIPVEKAADTRVDAVVVSGGGQNIMGMQDIETKAPVISASGRTPEEIWHEIQRRGLM
jgi:hypothetical protein